MGVTIYHNPRCGTSRNTLAMIRASGVEPTVIEYLKDPPSRETLMDLLKKMKAAPRDILRQKGTPYDELGLGDTTLSDAQVIDAMMENPILINRPIVVTKKGARLCRPSEVVLEILDNPDIGTFTKEDGEVVAVKATVAETSGTSAATKTGKPPKRS
ncbi:MAG: arsenate reductase (glutaredoxin) [Hyphomicrobiaceae bacterium]